MSQTTKRVFSPEFRLEVAQLVVDQNYTIREAARAMEVSISAVSKWIKQLREERNGHCHTATAITPEQRRIKELEKQVKRIELEKEILKKATALLMSDSMNHLK